MPTLFRFLMVVGVIAGVITGSLYVFRADLAEAAWEAGAAAVGWGADGALQAAKADPRDVGLMQDAYIPVWIEQVLGLMRRGGT